ncbi:GntT/GntP/DsdX family permease [Roseimaritima ulvae]|uniref:GntT/GntP/DsdX family permease n=1 Tax=Roseimaritima ulvae TaxID=980254 RepID=UPI00082FF93D|nr:gluconate:H+ symporter [Roseimaritima ulvae]
MSIEDIRLLIAFVVAVTLLVVLITKYSLSPFVSLLLASIVLAVAAGLPLSLAFERFAEGVGGILGSTAMVIGLGAMTGAILERSGGAAALAEQLVRWLGVKRLGWAMLLVGLLVGIGVWFTVGLVLLVPIVISLSRVARVNLLVPAMSMVAGLSAMHGFLPPHPGPLAAIELLSADTGRTIVWGLLVGSISAAIAGPLLWRLFDGKVEMPSFDDPDPPPAKTDNVTADTSAFTGPATALDAVPPAATTAPGVLGPLVVIALPIALMVAGADPTLAMLLGLVVAYLWLGKANGFSGQALARASEESLFPVANVLLVVAAGAGFSKVLIACGVGDTLASLAQNVPVPPLVLGWLISAAFRVATGSATTAITAAGGIISVMTADDPTIDREFMVLALAAGSLTLSHVNDGGFWFVKEYFAMTVQQTLKTWTVLETVLSLVALLVILILNSFV